MDFYEVVGQVLALLQRQGRVSYRALKRQFDVDDDFLEDLKEELLYAHAATVQADDRGFTWTGETADSHVPTRQLDQPAQQPAARQAHSPQAEPLPAAPHPQEAERRQLTVMFCDVVDSTKHSSQLDPESYREVVRAYQATCAEVIHRYDGHIAQLLGDGLLVYFGYPQAHEDDANRAVRTGLGIIEAMGELNTRLEQDQGITLAVRLGIHTGLVVVGEMGSAGRKEELALGAVPNVCARIQGLAEPNTVALSAATYRLIQGYFECQELGEQTLRGVAEPMPVYRALRESGVQSRLDVTSTRGLTPLVGREQEIGLLLERWEQAKAGHGQVVLLSGEGGIGKSRLVQVVKEHVSNEPHTRWECRSAPYYQNTALYPLIDLMQRTLRWQQDETSEQKLERLEQTLSQYRFPVAETMLLFAPLLSLSVPEDRHAPLHLSPQRQRQKTLESLVAMLLERAEREPVLFILEDLHWTDPTTLAFLRLLVEQVPTAALYMLLTCRPEFQPAWHHRSFLTEVTVNHLSRQQIEQMATHVAGGKALPADIIQQLVDKTDGVPLYVEEMSKALLESGHLNAVDGHYELTGTLPALAIPATLHDSLMARLDRLMTAKGIAQLGATIGRQFSYALLQAVSQGDEATLHTDLRRLVEAEIVYQRGLPPQATYTFKHALIQDAAYESLLKSTRQQYHQRIAQTLAAQFPETAQMQPELLAHHYTEAGLHAQAVGYWQQAGQHAITRSAHIEAIEHLRTGLKLLQTLPETQERIPQEVDMLIALGASLLATTGYATPEVGETYTYARQLCHHLEDPQRLFPVLRGLWHYYNVRAELQTAYALSEQLLHLAQQSQNPAMLQAACHALGVTLFYLGEPVSALRYLSQGITLSTPLQPRAVVFRYGQDAGVSCLSRAALALWYLGYPDQGVVRSDAAVTLAQQMPHPFSLSFALCAAAMGHYCRREARAVQACADAVIRLATAQGFPYWMAFSALLRGWALAQQGQAQEGIVQITQGLQDLGVTGSEVLRPYWLALLAEAHSTIGQPEAGLMTLTKALTLTATTGARWQEPELYRLKGALLLQQSSDNQTEAETCFQHALEVSRNQHAKSLELRAATSLARLWQQHGKRDEARQVLGDVYNWFTEGFDTADLKDARALLDELEDGR